MDPLAVLLMVLAAAAFITAGVLMELDERDEERRDRERAAQLEAHGHRTRAHIRALCEPRVRPRQP